MKTVTIIRNETVNGTKVEVGRKDFSLPANCDELFDLAADDNGAKEVYDFWFAAKVIALRATIGTKTKVTDSAIIAKARELKANGDPTLYNNLVSLEWIKD